MKTKAERHAWILAYMQHRTVDDRGQDTSLRYRYGVDVLNSHFVDAYCGDNDVPCRVQLIGANVCRRLGLDLAEMHREGKLTRARAGISGMGWGWPKWVWHYCEKRLTPPSII